MGFEIIFLPFVFFIAFALWLVHTEDFHVRGTSTSGFRFVDGPGWVTKLFLLLLLLGLIYAIITGQG